MTAELNGQGDPVEHGIRQWQQTKLERDEAVDRCRLAEQEAVFIRGQLDVLQHQHDADRERIRVLQEHNAELQAMTTALFESVLGVAEKQKAGHFRRVGSVSDGVDRLAAVRAVDADASQTADQDSGAPGSAPLAGIPARAAPGGIIGALERSLAPDQHLAPPKSA